MKKAKLIRGFAPVGLWPPEKPQRMNEAATRSIYSFEVFFRYRSKKFKKIWEMLACVKTGLYGRYASHTLLKYLMRCRYGKTFLGRGGVAFVRVARCLMRWWYNPPRSRSPLCFAYAGHGLSIAVYILVCIYMLVAA